VLDVEDVLGKRVIKPRLGRTITIRDENARAALEVMSRFAVDPRWLVYLPPTMSPPATAADGDLLERPQEAFDYYRAEGVAQLVCEEKHMGSRAVVVLCRDEDVAGRRFGIRGDGRGVIHTRTGRRFFADDSTEETILAKLDAAMQNSGPWDEPATDWNVPEPGPPSRAAKGGPLFPHHDPPHGAPRPPTLRPPPPFRLAPNPSPQPQLRLIVRLECNAVQSQGRLQPRETAELPTVRGAWARYS